MDREIREELSRTEAKIGDGPYVGIAGWKKEILWFVLTLRIRN